MQAFAALERDLWMSANGSIEPYQETRKALEKLFDRMDGLELTFDRIVERSCKCTHCLHTYVPV